MKKDTQFIETAPKPLPKGSITKARKEATKEVTASAWRELVFMLDGAAIVLLSAVAVIAVLNVYDTPAFSFRGVTVPYLLIAVVYANRRQLVFLGKAAKYGFPKALKMIAESK